MTATSAKLTTAVEAYFAELRRVRATGGGTDERSTYPALSNLLKRGRRHPQAFDPDLRKQLGVWYTPRKWCATWWPASTGR